MPPREREKTQLTSSVNAPRTTPYTSKFTGKEEQLPAAVGFIGAKGSDLMLADFVSNLFNSAHESPVTSGHESIIDEL